MRSLSVLILVVLLGFVACEKSVLPIVDSFETKIVGTWEDIYSENGVKSKTITSYKKEGKHTFSGYVEGGFPVGKREFSGSGAWKIQDEYLIFTVEKSDATDRIPNGRVFTYKIVSITKDTFIYIDGETQKTSTAKRIK